MDTNTFLSALTYAEVLPVYKKDDALDNSNYRPVSVVPSLSKLFESIVLDQINVFLRSVASKHLWDFRQGHSFQTALVNLVETRY